MSKRNPFDKRREILRNLLVDVRKKKRIAQTQLTQQLQKPQSFVSKYENGDCLIDLIETHQICQALNYSFGELATGFEAAINEPSVHYNKTQIDEE